VNADSLALDFNGVAVDNAGRAGYVGQGDGREEDCRESKRKAP
jgi:hypothetical protein